MVVRLKRSFTRTTVNAADLAVSVLDGPLEAARRREGTNAILLVDLDGFHVINNGLGRAVGDAVLREIAGRLEHVVSNFGQCLPAGGDRFVVLVNESTEDRPPLDSIATSLMQAVRVPIMLEGAEEPPVVVAASIGSVLDDGSPVDDLVRCADIALARAKQRGIDAHVSFEPEMAEEAESQARLERELRDALDTELLFLTYLPGVDIASGRLQSAEALLRWRHPERGVIPAGEFMPLLEQSGAIIEVGSWVLQEACMQAAAWQRRGMNLVLHVNLSPRQLGADSVLEELRDILKLSLLNPELLVLEVAEAAVLKEPTAMARRLSEFKSLGVRVAMDNFGTSYATLAHLKDLPIDMVEFDRRLVAGLGRDDSARALIETLVHIADGLGLRTLAAGVEDHEQLMALRETGCATALGHLYSEPVEASAFDDVFDDFEARAATAWPAPAMADAGGDAEAGMQELSGDQTPPAEDAEQPEEPA